MLIPSTYLGLILRILGFEVQYPECDSYGKVLQKNSSNARWLIYLYV